MRYIVDLIDDYRDRPATFANVKSQIDWQKAKSSALIDDVVKLRGIELLSTTSSVGTSFTAYLTEKQVEQLASDKRVALITQDEYLRPSALWNSTSGPGTQVSSWGLQAMDISGGSSNGGATVYVLDTGVALHSDLTGYSSVDQLVASSGISPVGCYSHATHVAGIIGAADNSSGVVGVLPGVRIVSIAFGEPATSLCPNVPVQSTVSTIASALDLARTHILNSGKTAIVNLSFNYPAAFAANGTLGTKMLAVATPVPSYWPYFGALVVQSAGNDFQDACIYAYDAPSPVDGILVIGGLDDNGQMVRPLNGLGGYWNGGGIPEAGSNHNSTGNCVEMWAPSQRVLSTWSTGTQELSGTSMAAPHVAGFAARLLENNNSIVTSVDLEAAVRAKLVTVTGSNLAMPRWTNTAVTARPTVEIAQGNNRSSQGAINFSEFPDLANLRFEAVGASSCHIWVTQNYWTYLSYNTGSSQNLLAGLYDGPFAWTVTCTSAQSTQTIATASGLLRRRITMNWQANTTSTGGNWQTLNNFDTVTWSIAGNAPFDQAYTAYNADSCQVETFGFTGPTAGDQNGNDPSNPYFNPPIFPPSYQQSNPAMWDSGIGFPTSYVFATFNFGDPHASPYGFAYYDGYKWKLTCTNTDGDRLVRVMYGKGL